MTHMANERDIGYKENTMHTPALITADSPGQVEAMPAPSPAVPRGGGRR